MPTQAAELEAPPQETQDGPLATAAVAAFEKTLAESADQTPPSDTPQSTSTVAIPCEPTTKPQGIAEKTWLGLGLKGRVYVTSLIKDGNALKAYEVAGYTSDSEKGDSEKRKRNAYNVSRGKRIQRALLEHADHRKALAEAKKDFALDWIVSEHERLMGIAERAGDYAVATRNLELIGRTRGVYADNVLVDVGARRAYSEAERIEAARLTRLAMRDGMGAGNDEGAKALEGDCGPVGGPGEAETAPGTDGEGGDSEEHTNSPITSSALPAPPPDGEGGT